MPDELDRDVEQRLTFLLARFEGWFDEETQMRLRSQIRQLLEGGRSLRAFPLTNADGPDCSFRVEPVR